MEELGQLKKELKLWEVDFYQKFNRKPKKEDLENAPSDVLAKYQKYKEIKKTIEATSDSPSEGADTAESLTSTAIGIWGKDLNKATSSNKNDAVVSVVKKVSSAMMGLGKKILQNSLVMKASPVSKRDLSGSKISSSSLSASRIESKPITRKLPKELPTGNTALSSESSQLSEIPSATNGSLFDRALKIVNSKKQEHRKPASDTGPMIPSLLMASRTGVQRKSFLSSCSSLFLESSQICDESAEGQLIDSVEDQQGHTLESQLGHAVKDQQEHAVIGEKRRTASLSKELANCKELPNEETVFAHSTCSIIDLHAKNPTCHSQQLSKISESRRRLDEKSISNNGPTMRRTNLKAANFSVAENCDIKTKSITKIKRTHSEAVGSELDEENTQRAKRMHLGDGEFSLQPDANEDDNQTDGEVMGDEMEPGTTESQKPSKGGGTKKRPPGNAKSSASVSSGNFVRLNMKLKRYKRKGGRPVSGPAAKRMAWKQKMQSRNQSRGNSCFKCGEPGHWAKDCKGKYASGSNNWSSKKEVEEWDDNAMLKEVKMEEFPTLEEAVGMAKGIRKACPDSAPVPGTAQKSNEEFELTFDAERMLYEPKASLPTMEPLYHLNEDGSLPKPPLKLMKALKKFGFSSFRLGQETAIMRVLCGLSTLVVLSTGAGKSLCYQLSAYMYAQRERCITLVISPLVSLMQDQVTNLPPGINGVCVNANMTAAQRASVLESVSSGNVHFLLLSPEMLVSGSGSYGAVNLLQELPPIAFACIDEAHCVSEWSHHFRPSYLTVCKFLMECVWPRDLPSTNKLLKLYFIVLRERYGVKCFLGLTATATKATAISISHHLAITDCENAIIRGAPIPANLKISVSRDENKQEALLGLLRGELFSSCQSIIIYCTRREETARVATIIRTCLKDNASSSEPIQIEGSKGNSKKKKGKRKALVAGQPLPWDAECYHAGLTAAQRKKIQTDFMSGYLRVVVATVAFGMGLDKSDIRGIIHYNISKTVESYIQEIGRAGRDGKAAYCHLFLNSQGQDNNELRRHIYSRSIDRSSVKKLVRRVFMSCRCRYLHNLTMEKKSVANDSFDYSELDKPWDLDENRTSETVSQDTHCVTDCRPPPVGCSTEVLENFYRCVDMGDEKSSNLKDIQTVSQDDERIATRHENEEFSENLVMETEFSAEPSVERNSTEQEIELNSSLLLEKSDSCHQNAKQVSAKNCQKPRICPGHERALPIEELVQELDMKEEGISTLLCYLELHPNKWSYNLQPVYANCKIQCYRGLKQLQAIAKKCPPIAVAIARQKGKSVMTTKTLDFNVVELSDFMGWESGPVKRELKLLQWESGPSGPQKSGVLVEFRDLAFHLRSPGDLTDEEVDEVINFLVERLETQERTELFHLQNFYQMLQSVSYKSCWSCTDRIDEDRSERLKQKLQEYLECGQPLENGQITALSFTRELDVKMTQELNEPKCDYESAVRADISAFIHIYRPDHTLTGRTIARVMHGIESPCFPAAVWGKVRRFWRCHLNVDFNLLRKIATEEMIRTR